MFFIGFSSEAFATSYTENVSTTFTFSGSLKTNEIGCYYRDPFNSFYYDYDSSWNETIYINENDSVIVQVQVPIDFVLNNTNFNYDKHYFGRISGSFSFNLGLVNSFYYRNYYDYFNLVEVDAPENCFIYLSSKTDYSWSDSRITGYTWNFQIRDVLEDIPAPYTFRVWLKFETRIRAADNSQSEFSFFQNTFIDSFSQSYSRSIYSINKSEVSLVDISEQLGLLGEINSNIAYDSSGVSDNLNSEVSSASAVESGADQAISSALPTADNQINDILSYDYTSIGTDSLTALSFWKSLGDYILSNSNLVGIGALLVACLFLGFVIFLLRL